MKTNTEIYGQVVRELRKQSGLTQGELAAKTNVRQATVSRWERGDREVPLDLAAVIAEACGSQEEDFFARANELMEAQEPATTQPQPAAGHVTNTESLARWQQQLTSAGLDNPNLLLVLFVLARYLDQQSWVVSGTIPEIAESAALPVGLVEDMWPDVLASPFIERVGSGKWTLRLVFPEKREGGE